MPRTEAFATPTPGEGGLYSSSRGIRVFRLGLSARVKFHVEKFEVRVRVRYREDVYVYAIYIEKFQIIF